MRKIIIASHEKMAEGIKDTLNYISKGIGNVHALSAYLTNTPVKEEVKELLGDVGEEDEVVVFTDLLGGSVNQAFAAYLDRPHFHIIAGINLPVIISVLVQPEDEYLTADQILNAVQEAREQLVYVNDFVANMPKDDEEDE
ncbi:PTS system mannose-specific IIA component [Paenibacillus forsythiae]|uniref:PTS system mannose-specific IIA component n=1 Tax=Paenibacillus forsythiae TaxID=365616 RepID=A0ABU3HBR6_9BACL|nr:PTS sugar transporter subunit IIA [Paenibacillus forsythiae]MDT3428253.1 PTS system mannose-specific IIA component [Paenibacillus forsythiae]